MSTYWPNSSESRVTLNLPRIRGTVYNTSYAKPYFSQAFICRRRICYVMMGRQQDDPFCSNPACVLYVRSGDPGVVGSGNWAELSDGSIIGRGIYYGLYLCDRCHHALAPVVAVEIV